jgi:sugar lactone lactonase YvrE
MWETFRASVGLLGIVAIVWAAGASRADTLFVSVDNTVPTVDGTDTIGGIDEIAPGGSVSNLVSDLPNPTGLAFGPGGILYTSTTPAAESVTIDTISPSGSVSTFTSGITGAYLHGLAFDGQGNLYVGLDSFGLVKVLPSGQFSHFGTADGQNVAFNSQGNLFSAATVLGTIYQTTPAGVSSAYSFALGSPLGMAFDIKGDLFVADEDTDTITEFTPSGTSSVYASLAESVSPFPAGRSVTFYGLAFDNSGNLYVAEGDGLTGAIGVTTGGTIQTYATLPGIPTFIADPSVVFPVPEPASFGTLCVVAAIVLRSRCRRAGTAATR